jgi:hypothetical protein
MVRRVMGGGTVFLSLLLALPAAAMAAAPSNDNIENATVITALPFSDSVDTAEATTAVDDPDCIGNGPTVWYLYTPVADQTLLADTFGSDYDTTLSVYTASAGSLVQIDCNDDAAGSLESAVVFDAVAGTTYYFMIGAFSSGPGGSLVFSLDESTLEPTQLEITVDPRASFDARTGSATITGTATCTEGAFGFMDVNLEQRVGRRSVVGFGFAFVECDGTSQAWSAEVFGDNGLFKGGPALATVFAEACGILDCAFDFEQRAVMLRR